MHYVLPFTFFCGSAGKRFASDSPNKDSLHRLKHTSKEIAEPVHSTAKFYNHTLEKKVSVYRNLQEALIYTKKSNNFKKTVIVCLEDISNLDEQLIRNNNTTRPCEYNLRQQADMKGSKSPMSKSPVRQQKDTVENNLSLLSTGAEGNETDSCLSDIKSLFVKTDKDLLDVEKSLKIPSPNTTKGTPKKQRKSKSAESSPKKKEISPKECTVKKKSPKKTKTSPVKVTVTDESPVKNDGDAKSSPGKEACDLTPAKTLKSTKRKKPVSNNQGDSEEPTSHGVTLPQVSPKSRKKASPKKGDNTLVEELPIPETESAKDIICSPKKRNRSPKKAKVEKAKESSENPEVKSPQKQSQSPKRKNKVEGDDVEVSGTKTRKSRSRSASKSPKKQEKTQDTICNSAVISLDFDDDEMKSKILKSAQISLPSDFKYQYSLTKGSSSLALGDLIGKISSNLKEKPEALKVLFGEAEEADAASSPDTSVISEGNDSDKTVTEFDANVSNTSITDECDKTDILSVKKSGLDEENKIHAEEKEVDLDPTEEEKERQLDTKLEDEIEDENNASHESCSNSMITSESAPSSVKEGAENKNNVSSEIDELEKDKPTVSIFEVFGLELKRKNSVGSSKDQTGDADRNKEAVDETVSQVNENDTSVTIDKKPVVDVKNDDSDDDVMIVSPVKEPKSIVISDSDEEMEEEEETPSKQQRRKFVSTGNTVEPLPLDILSRLEKQTADKKSAFACDELEAYLQTNKENVGPSGKASLAVGDNAWTQAKIKALTENAEPDIDDIDGNLFVSFASEHALAAHISLENKLDWLNMGQLKKMAQFRNLKERQQGEGTRRITDVKSLEEQKQNFRGVPMRMLKYQKLLKTELEDLLLGRSTCSPLKTPAKPLEKTADITKIKGWKQKFSNAESSLSMQAPLQDIKIEPAESKEVGLDLKKKRRKLFTYNKNKKNLDYEYQIDETVVTEKDVYNEEDEMPTPDKIPYHVKYLSQHKYGARKLFVKKMKLDAEDERILKKLGTQKNPREEEEEERRAAASGKKKGRATADITVKLTHAFVTAAVRAIDKKQIAKAKKMAKVSCRFSYAHY